MGAFSEITVAIMSYMDSFPSMPLKTDGSKAMAWENVDYDIAEQTLWLQAYHIPNGADPIGVGANALIKWLGIYQIIINSPSAQGVLAAANLADALVTYFKRGTIITTTPSNYQVRIQKCETNLGETTKDWYLLPISVYYYSYAQNV